MHALGREDRQRHQPRRARAARRPQGRARGHGDGRLAHRGRARAAARRRLRPRDRRRGHRRDRARRARARGRRRRAAAPARATASCSRCASTATRSCCAPATLSILADDGSGTSWDPIKVEGEAPRADGRGARRRGDADEPASRGRAPRRADAGRVAPDLWTGTATSPDAEVPPRDAYALRLVVGRRLYDNGRMVSEAPVLAARSPPVPAARQPARRGRPRCRVGRRGARHLDARLAGRRRSRPTRGVPAGVAQLDFSADGARRGRADRRDAVVTDLRVETLR